MNTATTTARRTHDYKEIKEPRMVQGIHQRRAIWSRVRPTAGYVDNETVADVVEG